MVRAHLLAALAIGSLGLFAAFDPEALAADDVCQSSNGEACALSALQTRSQVNVKTAQQASANATADAGADVVAGDFANATADAVANATSNATHSRCSTWTGTTCLMSNCDYPQVCSLARCLCPVNCCFTNGACVYDYSTFMPR